jgi:hypothetical protein
MTTPGSLVLALAPLALAADEPAVSQLDNHRILGKVTVAAPLDRVRTTLADPRAIARIDNGTTTVTLQGKEGACQLAHSAVVHPIASIEYLTKTCPTSDGFKTTLVKSEDLTDFETIWRMKPAGDKTELEYEIRTIPNIPVPQFVVDRQTRSSVHAMLDKVRNHLEKSE